MNKKRLMNTETEPSVINSTGGGIGWTPMTKRRDGNNSLSRIKQSDGNLSVSTLSNEDFRKRVPS